MKDLVVAFYGEGNAEYNFLMPLVERILYRLLPNMNVLPLLDIRLADKDLKQVEKMQKVAKDAHGCHLLIFHLDADAPDTRDAYRERFEPGYNQIQHEDNVNKDIVPVIPVRMTEAWMFVDFEAFCEVVGTKETAETVGFPKHPPQVESISDPKSQFNQAIETALQRRKNRKRIPADDIYRPLALRLNLDLLQSVPAYQKFEAALVQALTDIHYLDE